MAETQDDKLK